MNAGYRRRLPWAGLVLLLGMDGNLPFCNQQTIDPAQGNLHRVSDVVVVRPRANDPSSVVAPCGQFDANCALGTQGTLGGDCREDSLCDLGLLCDDSNTCVELPRTYVMVANPEIEQLRVYDAYERDFLRGPNVFFPLSVRTGAATRQLAVAPGDDDVVYALDSADDTVLMIRTFTDEVTGDLPFTVIGSIETGRAPGDIAAVATSETTALVFVTIPDQGAVEVYEIDDTTGASTQAAVIDLGEGSHPFSVAADPSGDAVVVTDAVLSSVAILRTDPLSLDRRIEVGGPTAAVATGAVDPGDGLGPVALIARRDAPEVIALGLYRPNIREDRYALLATAELPEPVTTLFVPDQMRSGATEPTVCCPGVTAADEATLAWAMVVSADGFVRYLRLDGRREGSDGDRRRGLLRLVDNDELPFGLEGDINANVASDVWFPANTQIGGRPSVRVEPVDNFGTPPHYPYWPVGYSLTLTWEGSPAGGRSRVGVLEGQLLSFSVDSGGQDVASRDIFPGDTVRIDTADRISALCPDDGFLLFTITGLSSNLVDVGGLSTDDVTCLSSGGSFNGHFFAKGAWVVESTRDGYLGRLLMDDDADPPSEGTHVQVPGIDVSVSAAEAGVPAQGSQLVLPLAQHVTPLSIELAQPFDQTTFDGFGQLGLLPTGIAGGDAWIQPVDEAPREVRRLFISIGGNTEVSNGRLLELNETETTLARVNSDNL